MIYLHSRIVRDYFSRGPKTFGYAFGVWPVDAHPSPAEAAAFERAVSVICREAHHLDLHVSSSIEHFFEPRDAEGRRAQQ